MTFVLISCQKQVDYTPQIQELTNRVNALQNSLNTSIAALQKSRDSLATALTQTNTSLAITNTNVSGLSTRMDSVKTAFFDINSKLARLTLRIDSANTQIALLNTQMASSISNTASLTSQITIINNNITNFTNSINILNQQYNTLIIILIGIQSQLNVTCNTLSDGLELWYPFSGNYLDSTSNHNGTNSNTTFTFDRNNNNNNAVSISNSAYIQVNNALFANNSNQTRLSFSIWLKTGPISQNLSTIFDKDSYWRRVFVGLSPTGSLILGGSVPTSYWSYETIDNIIKPNTWYHIAINYSTGTTIFYINGKATSLKSSTTSTNFIDFYTEIAGNSDGKVYIGRDHPVSGQINAFTGIIDDFRLYNRVLTQDEITYLANH